MNAMHDQELSPEQVSQITKAMLSVAAVDGIQPAEAALIGQFYETSRSADMPTTAAAMSSAGASRFDVADLAGSAPAFAETVVLMCLMAAYADGRLSTSERTYVRAIASGLHVDAARFDALLAQVRDELVGALSHLPDAESVAAVVKELTDSD